MSVKQDKPPLQPMDQKAGSVLGSLTNYMQQAMPLPKLIIGTVVSTHTGPPATLTVNLRGEDIPAVRYIGSTPSVADVVAVIMDGPVYVCLGVLT